MKHILSPLLLACLLIGGNATGVLASSGGTYDEAVEYVRGRDIADGYPDGTFRPEQSINRAEFSKIIMLAVADDEDMAGSFCFRDVGSEWFAPYVCAAYDHGMVSGYHDGTFRPGEQVTFAEASSLVAKAYHGDMRDTADGEWYTSYIRQLDAWDAIPPTVRAVHDPLTRGEMAYMVMMIEESEEYEESGETEEYEEYEEDDEEDPDVEVSVRALQTEAAPGAEVTFIIEVENGGGDVVFDLEATLESGLVFREAPDHDEHNGDTVVWENISLDEDEDETFTLIAEVRGDAEEGQSLALEVEADDDEDSAAVIVVHAPTDPIPSRGDPVLHWNAIALQANADDHTFIYGPPEHGGPGASSRALAIVHAAIYDAINAIERTHEPYIGLIPVQSQETPSMEAAVAVAAHNTLSALFPQQQEVFEASYQAYIAGLAADPGKDAGIRVGTVAARQILAARENDGSAADDGHTATDNPGRHRPDPVNPDQPFLGASWGTLTPFGMAASWQFRAPPPPGMTSPEYAEAFNEVKAMGGDGIGSPSARTEDQTEIGLFWAYDGVKKIGTPPRMLNQIARVIAEQQGNTVTENARLFALINLAMADAGIAAWESKYYYDLWRPVVGIREADDGTGPTGLGDGNPLTTGDPQWTPLGAPMSNMTARSFTPPFPAYPSGHATFGGAFFGIVEHFYGTGDIGFTLTSDELNGVTTDQYGVPRPLAPRSYDSLDEAARELNDSRIYLGVHWRFDQDAGDAMGRSIADYLYGHMLQPAE